MTEKQIEFINNIIFLLQGFVNENNPKPETLADVMFKYNGAQEYIGVVADCQKWYYGSLVKAPWCATWLSYCLHLMGLDNQITKKQENVYNLYRSFVQAGIATEISPTDTIKRGDVIFLCWSATFNTTATKHVCVAYEDSNAENILCIGGNQSDKVCITTYSRKYVVKVIRPKYA